MGTVFLDFIVGGSVTEGRRKECSGNEGRQWEPQGTLGCILRLTIAGPLSFRIISCHYSSHTNSHDLLSSAPQRVYLSCLALSHSHILASVVSAMNPFLDPLLTNIMQHPQSTSGSPASSVPRFSSPLRTSTSEQAASVQQQLQQQQQQQQSGFPTYNPLGTTQRIVSSGQLGSGRPSPRLITSGLSSGSHSSRPRSAVNRHPSPAALQPYRRRYNSISSLPPIQSASFNTMPAEWNEVGRTWLESGAMHS